MYLVGLHTKLDLTFMVKDKTKLTNGLLKGLNSLVQEKKARTRSIDLLITLRT